MKPTVHNVFKKASSPAKHTSITKAFSLGIGLLLLLMLSVAAAGYLALNLVRQDEKTIQVSNEIQRLVLDMDRGMEKARRLHNDFFLHYPQIGLNQAHELYAQSSVREVARVIAVSETLSHLLAQTTTNARQSNAIDLNLYLSLAKRFADTSIEAVELVTELAAPERGLEPRINLLLSSLLEETTGNITVHHHATELNLQVQKYRLSRERAAMQAALNMAFRLRNEHDTLAPYPKETQDHLHLLIDQFNDIASKILSTDVAIKAKFHDFSLQAESAAPAAATLIAMADANVGHSRQNISSTYRHALLVITGGTLLSLLAAILIAGKLNSRITVRILRLTAVARKLHCGNLTATADDNGKDELGVLARTLNAMGTRINDLVSTLEAKVVQRTAELTDSEQRFRQLFENSTNGIVVYEAVDDAKDFVIKKINKAVEEMEGVAREKILNRRLTEIFPGVDEFGLLETLRQVWQSGEPTFLPARQYMDSTRSGWKENSIYRLPSGEVVTVYRDLTDLILAQEEKKVMETRLHRAQKMEAIGLLAGGVAHDLNNILSGIVGYPQLLLMDLPTTSPLREPLIAIKESGERAAAVVADLLTVARGVASARIVESLNTIIQEYVSSPEHRRLLSEHPLVACTTDLSPESLAITCSPIHIKKCVMNLVTNAMEAINGRGVVTISTVRREINHEAAFDLGIETGPYAVLRVADTGPGIAEKDLEHIFEPFYTRKIMGRSGTGLGLTVVWNSIRDHRGTISVQSTTQGTVFDLLFPANDTGELQSAAVARQHPAALPRGNDEKILIVDDEPQLRNMASQMLQALGYQPTCVASGEEAVEYMKTKSADLLLLDMFMPPGINGRQTYEQILVLHPGQKAVIASGYAIDSDMEKALALGAGGFLRKPYSMAQLAAIIHETLTTPTPARD